MLPPHKKFKTFLDNWGKLTLAMLDDMNGFYLILLGIMMALWCCFRKVLILCLTDVNLNPAHEDSMR